MLQTHFWTKAIYHEGHGALRYTKKSSSLNMLFFLLFALLRDLREAQRFVVKLVLLEMSYLPTCSTQASSFLDKNALEQGV